MKKQLCLTVKSSQKSNWYQNSEIPILKGNPVKNLIIIKSSRKISIPGSRTKYHAITATCKSCGHSLGMAGIVPSETQAYTPKKNAKELHLKKRRAQKQARKQNRRK